MKPVNLLADIRDGRSLADQARLLNDRRLFVARMRHERAIGIVYTAPRRRAA